MDSDKGLATDRTALAWERMAIASAATAAIFIRQGIVRGLLGLTMAVAALLLLGAVMAWRIAARLKPIPHGQLHSAHHQREIAALALLIIVTAAGAAALAIFT